MAAYIIATLTVHDAETYHKYVEAAPPIVARYGGKYLTRGAPTEVLEGEPLNERLVIVEFPDADSIRAMFADADYQAAAKHRHASTTSRFLLQEGIPDAKNPPMNV